MSIDERFEAVEFDEYLKFDRITNKRSKRSDLHAFLLLDELFPATGFIVGAAEHDMIWLDINHDQINTLTDEQILELVRCGVSYDDAHQSLTMNA